MSDQAVTLAGMDRSHLLVAVADLVLAHEDDTELDAALERRFPGSTAARAMAHGLVLIEAEFGRDAVEKLRARHSAALV